MGFGRSRGERRRSGLGDGGGILKIKREVEEGGGDREGSGPLRGRANDGRQGVFSGQPKQAGVEEGD